MTTFNDSFERLLTAWRLHEEARSAGASIQDLASARWSLDAARLDVARQRPGWK